jgi:ornithine cyclodeaminase/alanine dehydrogenase-like protein (mu-crystallin family)
MITIVSEKTVKETATAEDIISAVECAYRDYASGLIYVPNRITLEVRGAENACIFLVANHLGQPYYALKQASSFSVNATSAVPTVLSDIHLYSADSGEPLSIVAANWLTALKTGAASAVATRYLAVDAPVNLAVIGCGFQARTQLACIRQVRAIKEIRLYDRLIENAIAMQREIVDAGNTCVSSVFDDPDTCVETADVICTCTTSMRPVFDGHCLKAGCHINAVGSFTPQMQEIDAITVGRADKVVVDQKNVAWQIAGDLLVPLEQGVIDRHKIYAELGSIVNGKMSGRQSDTEITIYESLGFAALDLAAAVAVYEKCLKIGAGRRIDWSFSM